MTDEAPDDGSEPPRPDLRFTRREDQGVSIERDMSGTGHLSRGSHTNMSRIRMSVRAQPREYLDPELAELRGPHLRDVTAAVPSGTAGADAVPPTADSPSLLPAPAVQESLLHRLSNSLRRLTSGR